MKLLRLKDGEIRNAFIEELRKNVNQWKELIGCDSVTAEQFLFKIFHGEFSDDFYTHNEEEIVTEIFATFVFV